MLNLAAFVLIAAGFFYLLHRQPEPPPQPIVDIPTSMSSQTAAVDSGFEVPPSLATTAPRQTQATTTTIKPTAKKSLLASIPIATSTQPAHKNPEGQAVRIKGPYSFAPVPFESINAITRAALVNILCSPRGAGSLSPVSGSGVIIDQRGVILTNAHVAQYVLLAQSARTNLTCTIRTGSPATPRWSAEVLYIPPVWVEAHAHEITTDRPSGTGEHDYALLRITGSVDQSPLPDPFPYVAPDTREAIGFQGDQVLAVSYPAEFLAAGAQFTMYPASSITTIGQLMTFVAKTVDLISLGGIIEAQGGSSGGAVVNPWARLIGIITTTSEGDTTAARDLRAITLSYISRDLAVQTQFDLATILGGDVVAQALDFNTRTAPHLVDLYIAQLSK